MGRLRKSRNSSFQNILTSHDDGPPLLTRSTRAPGLSHSFARAALRARMRHAASHAGRSATTHDFRAPLPSITISHKRAPRATSPRFSWRSLSLSLVSYTLGDAVWRHAHGTTGLTDHPRKNRKPRTRAATIMTDDILSCVCFAVCVGFVFSVARVRKVLSISITVEDSIRIARDRLRDKLWLSARARKGAQVGDALQGRPAACQQREEEPSRHACKRPCERNTASWMEFAVTVLFMSCRR